MAEQQVKVGDRVVVHQMPFPAYVERIIHDPSTSETVLYLDWKEHGSSRVFLHDRGNVWQLYLAVN